MSTKGRAQGVLRRTPSGAGLSSLEDVNLQGCRKVTSLAPLARLSRLACLNLRNCDGLTDAALAPLSGLRALRALDLSGCTHLTGQGCARAHAGPFLSHIAAPTPPGREGAAVPDVRRGVMWRPMISAS